MILEWKHLALEYVMVININTTTEEDKELKYGHVLLSIEYTWKVWQLQLIRQQNSFPHKVSCASMETCAGTQEIHAI